MEGPTEAGRLNAYKAAPYAMRAVQQVEAYIQRCGLDKSLIELVKMRASQINGCAYCLHVHSKENVAGGGHPCTCDSART